MTAEVFNKLGQSILSNDLYILCAAFIELFLFLLAWILASGIIVEFEKKKERKKRCSNSLLINVYNLFSTGISIFPLLGMFGTVTALLGLDLSVGDMTNIKNNFFSALTSTAWGIVFSIIFKLLHAWKEYYFEKKIEESTKLMEECNKLFERRTSNSSDI